MSDAESELEKLARPRALRGKAKFEASFARFLESHNQTRDAESTSILDVMGDSLKAITSDIEAFDPADLCFLQRTGPDGAPIIDRDDISSRVFLSNERAISLACETLQGADEEFPDDIGRVEDLYSQAKQLQRRVSELRRLAWNQHVERDMLAGVYADQVYDNSTAFSRGFRKSTGIHAVFAFIIVCCHLILHSTVGLSNHILCAMDLVCTLGVFAASAAGVPHDLRTALSWFSIDADIQSIACCPNPECCKLHRPDKEGRLPERCDAAFGSWRCNWIISTSSVAADGTLHVRPIREFHFQSIKTWVGGLLARPGMEEKMEQYVNAAASTDTGIFADIWHTGFLRNFRWGDTTCSPGFVSTQNGHLRLLFSLAIDWFTAHGGKQAGKKWSIGAIYLVCHNLPLEIRFLPENVCLVGIIPGRTKPLGQAVNWFLQMLVSELVDFFERGVWYTRTYKFPTGRLVWAALGPVVCDLDAARGIAGFGSSSHTLLCTLCKVTRATLGDFDTLFPPRCGSAEDGFPGWSLFMHLWNVATSREERDRLWEKHAIRWTELARLRYWNPFQYLVIDPMHNLFLGLFKRHFRTIWGMDIDIGGWGDELVLPAGQLAHAKRLFAHDDCSVGDLQSLAVGALRWLAHACEDKIPEEIIRGRKKALALALFDWKENILAAREPQASLPQILCVTQEDKLSAVEWLLTQPAMWAKMDKSDLLELCEEAQLDVRPGATKADLQDALKVLLEEREQRASMAAEEEVDLEPTVRPPSGKSTPKVVLGRGILSAISKDIQRTVLPDWIDPAPKHVGNSKHGKLSANNWRVFCSIHCIFTLIRLWGTRAHDSRPYRALENFIYLVKAVEFATMRTTMASRWLAYTELLKHYLKGLEELYPNVKYTPNQHLATHLEEFLRRFGPPHTWWAFPYERYNGMLQKIHTNDIIGSMEKTILSKYIQAARLRWLIVDGTVPKVIRPLLDWALGLMRNEYAGNLLVENDAAGLSGTWSVQPSDARLSNEMHQLLDKPKGSAKAYKAAKSIQHRGMTFAAFIHAPKSASPGNSIVHIKLDGETAPARIKEIAYRPQVDNKAITGDDVYVLVELYNTLSEADDLLNPYKHWRRLGRHQGLDCHLRYTTLGSAQLVPMSDVLCHAAMCQYEAVPDKALDKAAFVFLGLHRVRVQFKLLLI